jgi:hypothetical protein
LIDLVLALALAYRRGYPGIRQQSENLEFLINENHSPLIHCRSDRRDIIGNVCRGAGFLGEFSVSATFGAAGEEGAEEAGASFDADHYDGDYEEDEDADYKNLVSAKPGEHCWAKSHL